MKFDEVAHSLDFIECKMDKCVYVKQIGRRFAFLVLYVDDVMLVSNEAQFLQDAKNFLDKRLDIKARIWGKPLMSLVSKLTEIGAEDFLNCREGVR